MLMELWSVTRIKFEKCLPTQAGLKIHHLVKIPQQQDITMTEIAVHLIAERMDTKCQPYLMQLRVGE